MILISGCIALVALGILGILAWCVSDIPPIGPFDTGEF